MPLHIHKVATSAMNASNPSRSTMLDAMVKMCAEEDHILTEHEQVLLYNFFSAKIPKNPKSNFQWVALAVNTAKNDGRAYLSVVQVLDGVMTATDGHRLHQAPAPSDLASGYYDTKGQQVDFGDMTFPMVSRIIPPKTDKAHTWNREEFTAQDATSRYGGTKTKQIYVAPGWTTGFASKLWDDALGGTTKGEYRQEDSSSPARFDLPEGRLAVLMPIRL